MSETFEKLVLLVAQAMNSLNYQRRLNVLSTLFDSVPKVKEMIKERSKDWDNEDNSLLFGEKFKEELQKDSTAKIKTKNLFTGLKKASAFGASSSPARKQQPFRQRPFPSHRGGRGQGSTGGFTKFANNRGKKQFSFISFINKGVTNSGIFKGSSSVKGSFSNKCIQQEGFSGREVKDLCGKLENSYSRSMDYSGSDRISNSFSFFSISRSFTSPVSVQTIGSRSCGPGNRGDVSKRGDPGSGPLSKSVSELNIYNTEERCRV